MSRPITASLGWASLDGTVLGWAVLDRAVLDGTGAAPDRLSELVTSTDY
jgi:hypothetical protein